MNDLLATLRIVVSILTKTRSGDLKVNDLDLNTAAEADLLAANHGKAKLVVTEDRIAEARTLAHETALQQATELGWSLVVIDQQPVKLRDGRFLVSSTFAKDRVVSGTNVTPERFREQFIARLKAAK